MTEAFVNINTGEVVSVGNNGYKEPPFLKIVEVTNWPIYNLAPAPKNRVLYVSGEFKLKGDTKYIEDLENIRLKNGLEKVYEIIKHTSNFIEFKTKIMGLYI